MAWNTKYYTDFISENGTYYTVSIKEEDFAGGSTELSGGDNPFTIQQPEGAILDTIVGSGASIELISATPLQLFDLYSVEEMKYKVVLSTGANIQWEGWLDSETYEESYSEYKNYVVSFTANDGIALLDRINYVYDTSGDFFEGDETLFNVIKDLLERIGSGKPLFIPTHIDILVSGSVQAPPVQETFLHITSINQENYYDELDKPLSCREVLEAGLKTYGLLLRNNFLLLNNNSDENIGWVIYDNNVLADSSTTTFFSYNTLTGAYISSHNLGGTGSYLLDIENDLTKSGTGSRLTIDTPVNNQRVIYSPYAIINVLDASFNSDDFCSFESCENHYETITHTDCDDDQNWSALHYTTNPNIEILDAAAALTGLGKGIDGNATYTLEPNNDFFVSAAMNPSGLDTELLFKTIVDSKRIWGNTVISNDDFSEWALLIDWELFMRDGACYSADYADVEVDHAIRVDIGSDTYTRKVSYLWHKTEKSRTYEWIHPYDINTLLDNDLLKPDFQGIMIKLHIGQLFDIMNGKVTIYMTKYVNMSGPNPVTVEFRFKNFTAKLVRDLSPNSVYISHEDFISDDSITESVINDQAVNDGRDIDLIHGTRAIEQGLENGVMMYKGGTGIFTAIMKVDKGLLDDLGAPLYFSFENWLINKTMSNFDNPRVLLSSIQLSTDGIQHSNLTTFTDVNQFADKKFMSQGIEYDVYNSTINLSLGEVYKDSKDIIEQ